MTFADEEIQEKLAYLGTGKFHFNWHLVLLYTESLCSLDYLFCLEIENVSLFRVIDLPTLPQRYVYRLDKYELNVVKFLISRKTAHFTEYALMHQLPVDAHGYYIKGGNA